MKLGYYIGCNLFGFCPPCLKFIPFIDVFGTFFFGKTALGILGFKVVGRKGLHIVRRVFVVYDGRNDIAIICRGSHIHIVALIEVAWITRSLAFFDRHCGSRFDVEEKAYQSTFLANYYAVFRHIWELF